MDGFDDLLPPSRSMLEDNPFSEAHNPFGASTRSGSPDPWASPFGHSHDAWAEDHHTQQASEVGDHEPQTPVSTLGHTSAETPSEPADSADPSDPLDSAAANVPSSDEEDNKPLGYKRARNPSFRARESVDVATEDTQEKKDEESTKEKAVEQAEQDKGQGKQVEGSFPKSESPKGFSETATIRPDMIEEPEQNVQRRPTPPTINSSTSSLSGPSSPTAPWGSLSGQTSGGWGEHEPYSQPDYNDGISASATVVSHSQDEEDSDDDKPIGQLAQSLSLSPKPKNRSLSNRPDDPSLPPLFTITVDDPQKVGDPIRSYVMYTVHTRTTSPLYQKSAFSVLRRYSDFLWLYNTLSYNNPGVVVPPVPEKNPLLFTNPILGSAGKKGYVGRFDEGFIRQRRFALEKCIQKIVNHPVLCKDPDLKLFLESDTFALDIKHRKPDPGSPGPSSGIISSIGQTLASATGSRFYETDDYFDSKRAYLDSLEAQLRSLVKSIDLVSKHRMEMTQAISEFSDHVKELAEGGDFNTGLNASGSSQGQQLSQNLMSLAEVERKAQEMHVLQSEQDMITIMGTVDEYARLIGSVRLAFSSRGRMYQAWKNADADVIRVKQIHERNRGTSAYGGNSPTPGSLSKGAGGALGHLLSQIAEAEMRAAQAKRAFENTSRLCKTEMARFEEERVEDFRDALRAWLEGMIGRQTELIAAWESYQQGLLKRSGRMQHGRSQSISTQ
ncbi:Vps5 C terminal like-domain-containing protein [Lentinula detonsa]|uniref:Vps5 C terminal like-domain-containing protein n=1 Tax=Lentinula detonsa TaxID=2804962 RepID=A0AA38UTX3_9AGAR|nr:Vps5 C terminal like-domain-containing protein [Lentinula detonsa]